MITKKDKFLILLLCLSSIVEMLLPLIGVYFPKFVIEQISLPISEMTLIVRILGFTLIIGIMYYISKFLSTKINWKIITVQAEYIWEVYMKSLRCKYKIMESTKGQTVYQRAKDSLSRGNESCIQMMIPAILNISVGALGIIVYTTLLAQLKFWIIIFLILLSGLSIILSSYSIRYEHSHKNEWADIDKKLNYIVNKASDASYGKDIRLYKMQNWLLKLRDLYIEQRTFWYKKVENKRLIVFLGNAVTILFREGFAYIYLIWSISKDKIGVADFILYFGLIAGFSQWITKIANELSHIKAASFLVDDYRMFMELDETEEIDPNKKYKNIDKDNIKIEFKNVSFSYENTENNVINNLSFVVNPGEKLALVGINGAGKTTIVKLLCGLYQPTSGQILINDYPIYDYNPIDRTSLFSTVFQDSIVFPFTVAENVAMETRDKLDMKRVRNCIEKVNLLEHIENTYNKFDSEVLKVVSDKGLIFSGGQLQKLYLARALYKDGSVLILDEPTAALDPIAEKQQYLQYNEMCKNKTSIFISHRLASTSFCDNIAYLENGNIVEFGTHDQLLKINGKYAEMFNIQRQYYLEVNNNE